jgi:hypothetical protein
MRIFNIGGAHREETIDGNRASIMDDQAVDDAI